MTKENLASFYRDYIACLNNQTWDALDRFVGAEVVHNGKCLGLTGYREMLESDFQHIPDLRFNIGLLICEPPYVACRLDFRCAPKGRFLDLDVNGRTVAFTENVFYRVESGKIAEVWSVIDKGAIEAQLAVRWR